MSAFSHFDVQSESGRYAPVSGWQRSRVDQRYQAVCEHLSHYLSEIMVQSCIKQALSRRGVRAPRDMEELLWMVEEIMVGLRLFVPPSKLPELMVELSIVLEDER